MESREFEFFGKKNPNWLKSGFFYLVEVAGVEPASESALFPALHA